MKKNKKIPVCPNCGSRFGYFRGIGTDHQVWVCRNCGMVSKIDEVDWIDAEKRKQDQS